MAVESARLVAGNEVTAAMPAAGFRERAGYHRTRTTRCPSMGCRPCSGLDPPSRCKNVSCLCFGLGLAAGAGEVQRVARRPARSEYMQPIRCRASRRNRAAAPPACNPAAATRWTPGEGRGRRKRAPPAKTGSDEPRCTWASHNARSASETAPSGTEPLEYTRNTTKLV